MRDHFYDLVEAQNSTLQSDEVLLASFRGENSDFFRLNGGKVRQAGSVSQHGVGLQLIRGEKTARTAVELTLDSAADRALVRSAMEKLRTSLQFVPADPHLHYETAPTSTEVVKEDQLPTAESVLARTVSAAAGLDFVGSYASGSMVYGFANSLGQRNWHQSHSFILDWSLYHVEDRAVKASYSGFEWKDEEFQQRLESARSDLEVMKLDPMTIQPGKYRVYLAPDAVAEFVGTMSWSAFGVRSQKTKQSSLRRLAEGEAQFDPQVTVMENTADGLGPGFQREGFLKPDAVTLIRDGKIGDPLVSARSAKEYGIAGNGADPWEGPVSFDMAPGELPKGEILARLGTGLYVNNLWYMNYSDRDSCRMTGMTRFATFWVEDGKVVAPVKVMRFDESAYRVLGEELEGMTREREMIAASEAYGGRSPQSFRVPGVLVRAFEFTL